MNSNEAALALVDGFSDSSALFRHEVAYVLGQMQREVTVPGLSAVLNNLAEHEMVRHEAAESLGSIGTPECEEILASYRDDSKQVVKESCIVALNTLDYWTTPSELQGAVAIVSE
jgi:deoxyhypusine monooxygenase